MNFAKLDRQIDIERYVNTRTTSGAQVKTWEKINTFWAKVDFKSGGEKFEANQEQAYTVILFTIRFCGDLNLTEQMRIKYKTEYFDIIAINEIERNKYQQVEAKRKTVYQEL